MGIEPDRCRWQKKEGRNGVAVKVSVPKRHKETLGTARGGEAEDVGSSSLFTPTKSHRHTVFRYGGGCLLWFSFIVG